MFLYQSLRESETGYDPEPSSFISAASSNKNDVEKVSANPTSATVTQQTAPPQSEQTKVLANSQQLDPPRPQSFSTKPTKRIDDRLRELIFKYEIEKTLGKRLRLLEDYEIIIVCDDSGSMKTTVDGTDRTRWDELSSIVKIVLEIGTIFDTRGVDIYFLNRHSIHNVTNPEAINKAFSIQPQGYTPLVRALRYIFNLPATRRGNDKKMLVFVATDGAPTDDTGKIEVKELERVMVNERRSETTHVMFLLCTDDPACIDYLTEWDRKMVNVDITDDYKTEREKIRRFRGANYPFSLGDYVVKALVGAIDSEIDNLNEPDQANKVNAN